jgi:hypothetical protein
MIDTTILCKLLKSYLPELYKRLHEQEGYELMLNNLIYKWYMSVYSQNIPEDVKYLKLNFSYAF